MADDKSSMSNISNFPHSSLSQVRCPIPAGLSEPHSFVIDQTWSICHWVLEGFQWRMTESPCQTFQIPHHNNSVTLRLRFAACTQVALQGTFRAMHLTELTWPAVHALSKDTPVVIPVAALEQHGHHLPVFTDSMLLGEVVRRVSERFADRVLFAPLMWLGNSDHHMDFAGTLSAAPRTYLDLLCGLFENFLQHGFRRIVMINGHGGNDVPGKQAVFEVRQRHRERADLLLLFATYWLLGGKPQESDPSLRQPHMGHACEWETSMMLRLAPKLVGDLKQIQAVEFGRAFSPATRGWITRDRTEPGHIGDPKAAAPEKGETLFRVFADDLAALLERVLAWDGKSWDG